MGNLRGTWEINHRAMVRAPRCGYKDYGALGMHNALRDWVWRRFRVEYKLFLGLNVDKGV
jgi:hypothetical protein